MRRHVLEETSQDEEVRARHHHISSHRTYNILSDLILSSGQVVIDLYLAISHALLLNTTGGLRERSNFNLTIWSSDCFFVLGVVGSSIGQQLLLDNTEQNLLAGMGSALLAALRSYRDPRA